MIRGSQQRLVWYSLASAVFLIAFDFWPMIETMEGVRNADVDRSRSRRQPAFYLGASSDLQRRFGVTTPHPDVDAATGEES